MLSLLNEGLHHLLHISSTSATFLLILLSTAIFVHLRQRQSRKLPCPPKRAGLASPSATSKRGMAEKDRPLGHWQPVEFNYPPIKAYSTPIKEIKPIPYRPFKWGPYHVTMGIKPMPWDDWIELDDGFEKYHRIKVNRIEIRGSKVIRVLGDDTHLGLVKGGAEAVVETVHELAEYLSRRYPKDFHVVRHEKQNRSGFASDRLSFVDWGWDGAPPIKTITITSLGITYDLPISVKDGAGAAEKALEVAALLIQDDLALMIEGADGRYYFQAGAICLPGFWRLGDKIGLPLDEIHTSGHVPQYKERLQTSLERFFRRLPVDKPVARNNYFFQTNAEKRGEVDEEELAWSLSTLGPEDTYEHGSTETHQGLQPNSKIEEVRLRTERQTLRRLKRSGAILFTIRTYLIRVDGLKREEGVGERLASALKSWPEDVGEYKGKKRGDWWGVVVEYMTQRAQAHDGDQIATNI